METYDIFWYLLIFDIVLFGYYLFDIFCG